MQATAPTEPLKGAELGLVTLALSLATFMQVLDTTIANVSIPTIAGDLGVAPSQGTWVITSFAVANGISVPLTGWLAQRFGIVRTFTTATFLFTLASWLCGAAWNLESLIAFRVLQGAVAGPMIPLSQALLMMVFPPARKGLALALWAMTTVTAPIFGPLLGGYISDNFSWPWIFFINIPVGLGATYVTWMALRTRDTPRMKLPIDTIGLILLVVWVGALQMLLDKGREEDWFDSPLIIALAVISLIGFLVFLVWELTDRHPIVDLSLFKSRNFTVSALCISLGYGVFFGAVVLLPLWLQTNLSYTATWAGIVAAPTGMLALLLSPLVGKNIDRVDPRVFAIASFAIFASANFMRANFTTTASWQIYALPQLVQGAAMAMFFVPLISLGYQGLSPSRIAAASGMTNFLRITAGSFAASISTTVWDQRAAHHQGYLISKLSAGDPVFNTTLATLQSRGLDSSQALAVIARQVNQQAYYLAVTDYFWLSGWLCLALIVVVSFARPIKGAVAPVVAAE